MSLDGMAAAPKGSVDFIPASTGGDAAFGREQEAMIENVDTLLLGRVTYGMFAGFWPKVTSGPEKAFADRFNGTKKVIFSKTLERAPWGDWPEGRIVRSSPQQEVAKLKEQRGKDIMVSGSISVAQSLIEAGLIDEYRLVLCPVVLGDGRAMFDATNGQIPMRLLDAAPMDQGAVSLKYARVQD